jgi:hypothetical protein
VSVPDPAAFVRKSTQEQIAAEVRRGKASARNRAVPDRATAPRLTGGIPFRWAITHSSGIAANSSGQVSFPGGGTLTVKNKWDTGASA